MKNHWTSKRVIIIGAARQGQALARFLAQQGADVVLNDRRPAAELAEAQQALADQPGITWATGGHPLELLNSADLVCPSGGVPLDNPVVAEAVRRGIPLSNDTQIFLEDAPCRVVGITGSAGKTTTTTLVGRMAQAAAGRDFPGRAFVGGNIGSPLISVVDKLTPSDLAILEISSFQLEQMTLSPQVAAILNITPNHLDRHGTMEAYTAAKARLLAFQSPADIAVLGREDAGAWGLAGQVRGQLLTFGLAEPLAGQSGTYLNGDQLHLRQDGGDQALFGREVIALRGEHNLRNVLAACAIATAAGLSPDAMRAGVAGFGGVEHRLQFVRNWGGAAWYNDSIATAPERAMAAIRSFDEPLVLLAGGRDKNLPWEDFGRLAHDRVDHLIVFGEAAEKILKALPSGGPEVVRCQGLQEAVQAAAGVVSPGDVVLLAPGGTSFDEFKDFEERGACFVRWVNALP